MLRAVHLLARWIGAAHDRWRAGTATLRPLSVEIAVLHERVERLREENELLRARLQRIPGHRRPHYRPWERLRILWHQARHGRSLEGTARAFVVSVQTIVNWKNDVARGQPSLVAARRAVNALPDLVADLVHRLKREWPRWGTRRLAEVLARLGVEASRTTVQRLLRRLPRRPARRDAVPAARGPLVARHPNHLWFVDFTTVKGLFRSVYVGAVIDGYSRRVLSIAVSQGEPSAVFAVRLLRDAVRENGASPTWVVTDQGPQFTSGVFTRALRRRRIRRRFGAVGKKPSVSRIERFWRSMKTEYAREIPLYGPIGRIEARLRLYADWFNAARPHQGIRGRTPDEVHFERSTRATRVPLRGVLEVDHVGRDRLLPVVRLRRAA
jgi:transposase InsO family protein